MNNKLQALVQNTAFLVCLACMLFNRDYIVKASHNFESFIEFSEWIKREILPLVNEGCFSA